jgi:hypothetical protein
MIAVEYAPSPEALASTLKRVRFWLMRATGGEP